MLLLKMNSNLEKSYGGCTTGSASIAEPEITPNDQATQASRRPNTRAFVAAENRRKYPNELPVFKKRPRLHDNNEIATLCNIGNTCYLNSVLYTLRFAPNFLNNLHHLVGEQTTDFTDAPRSNHQIAIEELHDLYAFLHTSEVINLPDAFQTNKFLTAMQNVSSVFKGKHQQDAHEFLMCILNSIQEMCYLKNYSMFGHFGIQTTDTEFWDLNSFSKDFEGVTKSSTKCVLCETVTENEQKMYYLSVPINYEMIPPENPNLFIQKSCVTREKFDLSHNYRCKACNCVMEAVRTVSYPILPRLLIFQLMRFSTGMQKISNYVPTPLTILCFCNECYDLSDDRKLHVYKLYGVIAHVGAKLSSGHYVAYTSSLAGHSEKSRVIEKRNTLLLNGAMDTPAPLPTHEKNASFHCCGLLPRNASAAHIGHANGDCSESSAAPINGHSIGDCSESSAGDVNMIEPTWYKCDDEKIKTMTQQEFEDLLTPKKRRAGAISPYLLFYARTDIL